MKRILKITALSMAIMLFNATKNTASAQFSAGISYQTFYDDLSPYGQWIDYPEYGYVWCPDAGPDFRPYSTMGHWEWSDEYEWIWVSDYSWGWAPFHYGRWLYDPYYGWMWVPGYEWAPAWVVWRSGGDYCGWAPLRPGFSIGINFSIGLYSPPIDYWCFAPRRYITSPRIYDYCVSPRQNITIINNTTIINNYNYNSRGGRNVFVTGPRRNDAESWTHQRIRSVNFRDADRPGRAEVRHNEVSLYRPNINRDENRGYAPRNFDRYNSRGDNNRNRQDNNSNVNNRSNNLPQPERSYGRNDNGRQTRDDRNIIDRRNGNDRSNNNDQRRMNPNERRDNSSPYQNRGFEQRNNRDQNKTPQQDDRRQYRQPQQQQPRQVERQQPQQQPRQVEKQQPQQPRQVERQQQQPPYESRGRGNSDHGGNNGNGKGHGRRG